MKRSGQFDETDLELLRILQANPRATMSDLARRVDMSSPAVTERVARLEEDCVIAAYRLELNPVAFGHPLIAFVRIRPLPGQLAKVADLASRFLKSWSAIESRGKIASFSKSIWPMSRRWIEFWIVSSRMVKRQLPLSNHRRFRPGLCRFRKIALKCKFEADPLPLASLASPSGHLIRVNCCHRRCAH